MRQQSHADARRPAHAPLCRVSGQIKNPAGMPLGGARVTLYPQEVTIITSPDGAFSVLLPPGPVELVASSDGRESRSIGPVNLVAGGALRTDMVLPRSDGIRTERTPAPGWGGWQTGHRASVR